MLAVLWNVSPVLPPVLSSRCPLPHATVWLLLASPVQLVDEVADILAAAPTKRIVWKVRQPLAFAGLPGPRCHMLYTYICQRGHCPSLRRLTRWGK